VNWTNARATGSYPKLVPSVFRKLRSRSKRSFRLWLGCLFRGDGLLDRCSLWGYAVGGGTLHGWRCGIIRCFFLRSFPYFRPTCLLRAGFVTEASAHGASDRQIMRQTGHKSRAMIDRYSRAEQRDRQSAVSKLVCESTPKIMERAKASTFTF